MPVPHDVVTRLAAEIEAAPAGLAAMRLVCVDGLAGAGKTTLSAQLAVRLGARVVHMDDLYDGWAGLEQGVDRLVEWVLEPLAAGEPGRYRRYDWGLGRYVERHTVPLGDELVVEGVGSASLVTARFDPFVVWVEARDDVRLERGLARDGAALEPRWRQFMVDEAAHHAANRTRERAHVRFDGVRWSRLS